MVGIETSAKAIFLDALECNKAEELTQLLERACGVDTVLRTRVEELLQAHREAGAFLRGRPDAAPSGPIAEHAGAQIGPYKLLQAIGEGGMGDVYMAEQTEPVRRMVALKVIKPGMDSRQVTARFEAERQALAMMDHINIARVLDAGATDSGRPYFVMELVHGVPITKYCDDNRLTLRQRLELFVPVCRAIQHAHQKGIVHRDIKPSNVMVTLYDGQPVPKVIDFGVAKATEQKLTERTLFTQYGTMVGTLEYMSPEQAEMSALAVDTRSDIFSLGVLLYELLTGSTPLTHQRVREAAYAEVLRIIKEEEPQRPSTRLSSSGQALASISAQRQIEPAKLMKLMCGELDWIVMKTLEKDRNRRYESASGLAADVQHYLNDEPVQACPSSKWYRFRKLAGRNKGIFAVATAAVVVVLLGVVTLAGSNLLIRQEQARTRDAKNRAEHAQKLAEKRADEIRQGLERLKAANALLERAKSYDLWQHWDDAAAAYAKAIELREDHAPAWEGRGELYARLGLWELAAADLAKAAELQPPANSGHWYSLALLRVCAGDLRGYRADYARMSERFQGSTKREFTMDIVRVGALVADPTIDPRRLVELAEAAVAAEPGSHWYHHALGVAHYRAGQYELAVERLSASPAGDPDWIERPMNYPFLAMAYYRLGQHSAAEQALADAAGAIDQWTGARYQNWQGDWVITHGATAEWQVPWWRWLACQLFYSEAREVMGLSPTPDDPRLHVLRARAFAALRRNFAADVEYAAALKLRPDDLQIRLESHRSAAFSAVGRREWRRAAIEFAEASKLAPDEADLWRFRALALLAAEDEDAYRQTCLAMLQQFEKTTDVRVAGNVLMVCVLREDAVPDMARLLPLAEVAAPWGHTGAYALGEALYRAGRYEEAVKCIEKAAKTFRPGASEWSFLAMAHHRQGHAGDARDCLARAARWIDEANRQKEDDLSGTRPAWGGWHEPVVYPLLLREAEELLRNESAVRVQKSAKSEQPQ